MTDKPQPLTTPEFVAQCQALIDQLRESQDSSEKQMLHERLKRLLMGHKP